MKKILAVLLIGGCLAGCSAKDKARIDNGLAVAEVVVAVAEVIGPPEEAK